MNLQDEELHLTPSESPAEPASPTLEDAANNELTILMHHIQAYLRLTVERGDEVVAQYRSELKDIQRYDRTYMPYDLRASKAGKSEFSFKAIWIRKPYVDYYFGPTPATKYKVAKATHTTSLTYIRRRCPDSILPLVEETEARLTPIRKELHLASEVLALIERLQNLHASLEESRG